MNRLRRPSWIVAIIATLAYLFVGFALPAVLVRSGMTTRSATGVMLHVLIYVGPFGLLAAGAFGLLGQALQLPGWSATVLLIGIPSLVSGACCGGLTRLGQWARVNSRPLFLALVLVPALYWSALLAFDIAVTPGPSATKWEWP